MSQFLSHLIWDKNKSENDISLEPTLQIFLESRPFAIPGTFLESAQAPTNALCHLMKKGVEGSRNSNPGPQRH